MAKAVKKDAAAVAKLIEEARAKDEFVTPTWLRRQDRYAAFLDQIDARLAEFAEGAAEDLAEIQRAAAQTAIGDTEALYNAAAPAPPDAPDGVTTPGVSVTAPVFDRLPTDAVETLIGFAADGSPLSELLVRIGPDLSEKLTETLVSGFAKGTAARTLAAELVAVADGKLGLARAENIARTTINQTYREASRQSYAANPSIIRGYVRISPMDGRSCIACCALHGTRYAASQLMPSHPQCRCAILPDVPGGPGESIEPGPTRFAGFDEALQKRILGPQRHAIYKAGLLKLESMYTVVDNPDWGPTTRINALPPTEGPKAP